MKNPLAFFSIHDIVSSHHHVRRSMVSSPTLREEKIQDRPNKLAKDRLAGWRFENLST
jgi:hypothetical protein